MLNIENIPSNHMSNDFIQGNNRNLVSNRDSHQEKDSNIMDRRLFINERNGDGFEKVEEGVCCFLRSGCLESLGYPPKIFTNNFNLYKIFHSIYNRVFLSTIIQAIRAYISYSYLSSCFEVIA